MRRFRTEWAPKGNRVSVMVANIFRAHLDPKGLMRHRGKTAMYDQWHYAPVQPSVSNYGLINVWDFNSDSDVDIRDVWDETSVGTGISLAVMDERPGVAKFRNGASDNDYYYYFAKYETAKLQSGKGLWFRTDMRVVDVDQADVFIGLCKRLASGNVFDNRVDAIGFYMADGSTSINCECIKNGFATQKTGKGTSVDDTFVKLDFHVSEATVVEFFIDNVWVCTIEQALNIPDDEEMSFVFGCRNGQAAANEMSIKRTVLLQDE